MSNLWLHDGQCITCFFIQYVTLCHCNNISHFPIDCNNLHMICRLTSTRRADSIVSTNMRENDLNLYMFSEVLSSIKFIVYQLPISKFTNIYKKPVVFMIISVYIRLLINSLFCSEKLHHVTCLWDVTNKQGKKRCNLH